MGVAKVAASQELQLKEQLQSVESAAQKTRAVLRARVAASQQQDAHDSKVKDEQLVSQEEKVEHLQDRLKEHDDEAKKEDAKLQASLAVANAQLQDEQANDAVLLRGAKAQLEESEALRKLTIFSSASALISVVFVAAFALRIAHKKKT